MVEVGGKPLLWHIMKLYSHYGVNDFVVCAGYKGYMIKEYFANYFLHNSDVTFDLGGNSMQVHRRSGESWRVTVVDTGELAQTGSRLKRVESYLKSDCFCFAYGDCIGDVSIQGLLEFHAERGKLVTLTAVQPPGRYGLPGFSGDGGWINGGFFVVQREVLQWIGGGESVSWESDVLPALSAAGQLVGYKHLGYWQGADRLMRDGIGGRK
jgi:glucose-1-phosphate cytidylyltransferase